MFDFLRRKLPVVEDFSFLEADMHAHWLPGIDDGAETVEDSLEMIKLLVTMGYRKLIATPHVMTDLYHNTPEIILQALEQVKQAVHRAGIRVELAAAAEYLLDEGFPEKLGSGALLALPNDYLLVEYSFVSAPANQDALFFDIQTKGYRPILAHPERYHYLHRRFETYRWLVDRGVILQVNLLSLTGYYGKDVKKIAERLIDDGLVSLVGTDAHHTRHLDSIRGMIGHGKYGKYLSSASLHNQQWLC